MCDVFVRVIEAAVQLTINGAKAGFGIPFSVVQVIGVQQGQLGVELVELASAVAPYGGRPLA